MYDIKEIVKQTQHLNVLFVEDEALIRESSLEMFNNFFATTITAINGKEALKLYEEQSFDLIITDIYMPVMDGIEFIEIIRSKNKRIPIIVFSALNEPSYINTCITLNVDAYILKPMKMPNLLDSLQKINYKKSFDENFNFDQLTNLKSHNALLKSIKKVPKNKTPVIILINIDDFHIYNEIYGLSMGDFILSEFANILNIFAKANNYEAYRMGGDEFVLFETTIGLDPQKYEDDMEALFSHIDDNPISIKDEETVILPSISVGLSFDIDNSYAKADMALQEARKRGRRYLGFSVDADKRKELKENLYWKKEVTTALTQERVSLYYNPIVDKEKNILKYESILKIRQLNKNGTYDLISPNDFIDFSKILKQYINLTTFMINESFDVMIQENVHIAINLTFHDIHNRELNKLLHTRVANHTLATLTNFDISSQIIFELLEHSNHEDYDDFIHFVEEFQKLGVIITIDNFGLGFANMSKIAAMTPNYVKIDSALIKNIDTDKHAYTLVKAIVKFSKELGIKTIAESISTQAIFEVAQTLEIDEFQGSYFGKLLEKISSEEKEGL